MKPNLILGLGNPLMGDDGIGWRIAELLSNDPRLPSDSEALCAGADLLRWAHAMEGRKKVILIDAILADAEPGSLQTFEDSFAELEICQWNVHHLSPPLAVCLLQSASPGLRDVRFTFLAIAIHSIEARPALSPELNEQLPEILDRVLRGLRLERPEADRVVLTPDRSDAGYQLN
jgi:hydrogenase maturation protease